MRLTTAVANISLLTLSAFQVDAFQTHRRAFLSPSRKTALQPCRSEKRIPIDRSLVAMSSSGEDEKSIEELYRIAMEEDEEWYNEFVRDVLGEENITKTSSTMKESEDDIMSEETNPVPDPPKMKFREVEEQKGGNTKEAMEEIASSSKIRDTSKEDEEEKKIAASKPSKVQEILDNNEDVDAEAQEEPASENSQAGASSISGQTESTTETKTTPDDDVLVQYTDMFDNVQRVPLSTLSDLGYDMADIARLQAAVIELIIDDKIVMPKDGIPRRWMVESRDSKEVKILRKRVPVAEKDVEDDDGRSRKPREPRSRNDRPLGREGDGRSRNRRKLPDEERRGRRRSSERSDEGEGDTKGEPSALWMDIPTFKQYLRREADLRLMILGPDWEDWVKGESDWRLDLYKKWLNVVENGIGDDIMDEMSYVPETERQKSPPRKARKRVVNGDAPRERRVRSDSEGRRTRRLPLTSDTGRDERQRKRTPEDDPRVVFGNETGGRSRRERQVNTNVERPLRRSARVEDDFSVKDRRALRNESVVDEEDGANRRPRRSDIDIDDDTSLRSRPTRRRSVAEDDDYDAEMDVNVQRPNPRTRRERRPRL